MSGYEQDIHDVIDAFVREVADGSAPTLSTFKSLWKDRKLSFIHQAYPTYIYNRNYTQLLFATALDRFYVLDPLRPIKKTPPQDEEEENDAGADDADAGGLEAAAGVESTAPMQQDGAADAAAAASEDAPAVDPLMEWLDSAWDEVLPQHEAAADGTHNPEAHGDGEQHPPAAGGARGGPNPLLASLNRLLESESDEEEDGPRSPPATGAVSPQGLDGMASPLLDHMAPSPPQGVVSPGGFVPPLPDLDESGAYVPPSLESPPFSPGEAIPMPLSPPPKAAAAQLADTALDTAMGEAAPGLAVHDGGAGGQQPAAADTADAMEHDAAATFAAAAGGESGAAVAVVSNPKDRCQGQHQQQQQQRSLHLHVPSPRQPMRSDEPHAAPQGAANGAGTSVHPGGRTSSSAAVTELAQAAAGLHIGRANAPSMQQAAANGRITSGPSMQQAAANGPISSAPSIQQTAANGSPALQPVDSASPVDDTPVPLDVRAAVMYCLFLLHATQRHHPKVSIYVPVPIMKAITETVPLWAAACLTDAVEVVRQLHSGQHWVLGALRRPALSINLTCGKEWVDYDPRVPGSFKRDKLDSEVLTYPEKLLEREHYNKVLATKREALFHVKSSLKALAHFGNLQGMCDDYHQSIQKLLNGANAGSAGAVPTMYNTELGTSLQQYARRESEEILLAITAKRPTRVQLLRQREQLELQLRKDAVSRMVNEQIKRASDTATASQQRRRVHGAMAGLVAMPTGRATEAAVVAAGRAAAADMAAVAAELPKELPPPLEQLQLTEAEERRLAEITRATTHPDDEDVNHLKIYRQALKMQEWEREQAQMRKQTATTWVTRYRALYMPTGGESAAGPSGSNRFVEGADLMQLLDDAFAEQPDALLIGSAPFANMQVEQDDGARRGRRGPRTGSRRDHALGRTVLPMGPPAPTVGGTAPVVPDAMADGPTQRGRRRAPRGTGRGRGGRAAGQKRGRGDTDSDLMEEDGDEDDDRLPEFAREAAAAAAREARRARAEQQLEALTTGKAPQRRRVDTANTALPPRPPPPQPRRPIAPFTTAGAQLPAATAPMPAAATSAPAAAAAQHQPPVGGPAAAGPPVQSVWAVAAQAGRGGGGGAERMGKYNPVQERAWAQQMDPAEAAALLGRGTSRGRGRSSNTGNRGRGRGRARGEAATAAAPQPPAANGVTPEVDVPSMSAPPPRGRGRGRGRGAAGGGRAAANEPIPATAGVAGMERIGAAAGAAMPPATAIILQQLMALQQRQQQPSGAVAAAQLPNMSAISRLQASLAQQHASLPLLGPGLRLGDMLGAAGSSLAGTLGFANGLQPQQPVAAASGAGVTTSSQLGFRALSDAATARANLQYTSTATLTAATPATAGSGAVGPSTALVASHPGQTVSAAPSLAPEARTQNKLPVAAALAPPTHTATGQQAAPAHEDAGAALANISARIDDLLAMDD